MIPPQGHERFRRRVDAAREVALVTHINPDGDALGSQVSLGRFLLSRGKRVRLINHDPTAAALRFVEHDSLPVEVYDPAVHDAVFDAVDTIMLVDNSAPDRLGRMEPVMLRAASRTLCIDHHPMRHAPWAETIVDEGSCATAAMIWELTRGCGWTPDGPSATAIYVGLATDTGFFRYNSTTAAAHELAAELLRLGVEPARTFQEIYERNSVAFTRLLGHALAGLTLDADGAIASVRIPRDLLRRLHAEDVDTTEITTALLAIEGVRIVQLFRELADGRVKVSLRSKGGLDVHALAIEFGGGGHRNASGIVMAGALDDVAESVGAASVALLDDAGPQAASGS